MKYALDKSLRGTSLRGHKNNTIPSFKVIEKGKELIYPNFLNHIDLDL